MKIYCNDCDEYTEIVESNVKQDITKYGLELYVCCSHCDNKALVTIIY